MKRLTEQALKSIGQEVAQFSSTVQTPSNTLKAAVKRHLNAFKRCRLKPCKNAQKPEFAATGAK